MTHRRPARLCLADGSVFEGFAFGAAPPASGSSIGEVVFTTGMTGYQEVLTDPSYTGQLVTMTAPQIGNTGVNFDDAESVDDRPRVAGFIVRESSDHVSNWRANDDLGGWLAKHGICALTGIDTRRLTRHLRDHGAQNGAIGELDASTLVDHARAAPSMEGLDLASRVSCAAPYAFEERTPSEFRVLSEQLGTTRPHVVAIDFGLKRNILRSLVDAGCRVTVVPASTRAEELLAHAPHGVFLSNGPGDPAAVTHAIATTQELLGKIPLFGICLGHQILALAAGASTYKLKFGHRGLNQPVKELDSGRIEITSQNHGFAVDVPSLPKHVRATHVHLNDGTSEGLSIPDARAFSVQYHPEAAAGPHDSLYLFRRFVDLMGASPR